MKKLLAFIFFLLPLISISQTDKKLQKKVTELLQNFKGTVGVYVKNLRTGKTVSVNADTIFPTASMVKVPILIGVMNKIHNGEIGYHQQVTYKDSLLYAGSDILGSFKNDEKITIAKTIMLMLTTSDNTASLWLQSLAGTGTAINRLLDSIGLKTTRVNSRTQGREQNREQFGWGQTTPREMAFMFEKIYRGEVISDSASKKMLRLLGRNYWDEQAISMIPPGVFVASKNGCVNASRSETLLVMAPKNPYIFSICTKNQKDISWSDDNEGWMLAKKLSALLWAEYGKGYN